MAIQTANPATLALLRAGTGTPALADKGGGARFGQVWSNVNGDQAKVTVQSGDTLIGLVKAHHRQQGLAITETQAYRWAHRIAAENGIANPDRILPGQRIDFASLQLPALARATEPWNTPFTTAENALANRPWQTPTPVPPTLLPQAVPDQGYPVLDQTLQRAVDKGYIPAGDLPAVRSRVLSMADRFRFSPDDFARLTLMESGGMNPKASNGRCHGIIQFCDGPARGAASVGYRDNPKAILGLPLLQQLDLVERYFSQLGLGTEDAQSTLSMDDLYLSVLMPAARSEKRRHVALDIPGPQASYLHVDRDRQKPITRDSLTAGLYAYTNAVLLGAASRHPAQQWARQLPLQELP